MSKYKTLQVSYFDEIHELFSKGNIAMTSVKNLIQGKMIRQFLFINVTFGTPHTWLNDMDDGCLPEIDVQTPDANMPTPTHNGHKIEYR